ncbi:MAG: hypothetical protein COB02_14065 [Candidatus Cloacimonadota bacterium]|nr:MAG: hypothetical protein COB02_14065 [Candidatus Cloacimonadota bacterium]
MINGNYLKYFYWTVKENSSKKAGQICHKTQSAISQAIKSLEISLDTNLLIRYNNYFELTEEGKDLYVFAQKYIDDFEILQKKLHAPKIKKPQLKIGISQNYEEKVSKFINLFLKKSISYELSIESWDGDIIRKKFSEGNYDIIFGIHFEAEDRIPTSSFEHNSLFLFDDKIGLCADKNHHEFKNKNCYLENLLEYPMILSKHTKKAIQTQIKNNSIKLNAIALTNNPKTIANLMKDTDYISLLSECSIPLEHKNNIKYFNEKSLSANFPIVMSYRTEPHFGCNKGRQDFLNFTKNNLSLFNIF